MFTKLHKEERDLLFKTNSVVAYEVYMHLKDKYSYFKAECYDLTRCISDYLDVPERTIKDAIKRLKTVGLISTTKKGKVNIYSFPILNKIEGKEIKEEVMETPQVAVTGCTSLSKPVEEKSDTQPQQVEEKPTEVIKTSIEDTKINITEKEINEVMGTYKGTIEELNKRTTINDFSSIDRLVPKLNKEMALKQIKPYHSREKNIGRLNDALSTFLKDVSSDDRAKYYEFILEKSFAVA